jgi:hypothetical protein
MPAMLFLTFTLTSIIIMPVILASLVFAISLSLLPYTDSQDELEAAEMDRLRNQYLSRKRRSIDLANGKDGVESR